MSDWFGLRYPLKPGSEDAVKGLFDTPDHPDLDVTDTGGRVVGRLLGTLAFVGGGVAVRLIEVDGPTGEINAHMGRQPAARDFQRRLQPHLAADRDMNSPESMREFFQNAALECVLARRIGSDGFKPAANWTGLYYPLKPGSEDAVRELFNSTGRPDLNVTDESGNTVGRLLGTLAFVGRGAAVRLIEVDGPGSEINAHMSRQPAARDFQQRLQPHLATDRDMNSPESMREFFRAATLECVLARHNGGR